MWRQIAAPSGRALWRYAVPASANATLVLVQVCVKQNVLQEATLAVYEDGRLAWCAAAPPRPFALHTDRTDLRARSKRLGLLQ